MMKRQREQAKRDKKALKAERRAQKKHESDDVTAAEPVAESA